RAVRLPRPRRVQLRQDEWEAVRRGRRGLSGGGTSALSRAHARSHQRRGPRGMGGGARALRVGPGAGAGPGGGGRRGGAVGGDDRLPLSAGHRAPVLPRGPATRRPELVVVLRVLAARPGARVVRAGVSGAAARRPGGARLPALAARPVARVAVRAAGAVSRGPRAREPGARQRAAPPRPPPARPTPPPPR